MCKAKEENIYSDFKALKYHYEQNFQNFVKSYRIFSYLSNKATVDFKSKMTRTRKRN